jgi:hypothetical protein
MESRFSHDFSGVRLHTDQLAARSAKAVGAHAYTVGSDVVFASGRYAPASHDGQRLLAHELAHVVQQDGAMAAGPLTIQDAGDPAERAADSAADRLILGESVVRLGSRSAALQRQSTIGNVRPGGVRPGVVSEKFSGQLEEAYRRTGQGHRADAIYRCRVYGEEWCLMILTEGEARAAYKLAKEGYSPREAAQKARPTSPVQRLARAPDVGAFAETLPLTAGGGAGIGTGLRAVGARVLAVLPAAALAAVAALFLIDLIDEVRFGRFVNILEENWFITLLNPFGACIGACHYLSGSRAVPQTITWEPIVPRTIPWEFNVPKPQPKEGPETTWHPFPVPAPRPEPDERRRKRKCLFATGLTAADPIPMRWFKPRHDSFYPKKIEIRGGIELDRDDPHAKLPDGTRIGVQERFWPRLGKVVRLGFPVRSRSEGQFRKLLAFWGYRWSKTLQADHVQDLQWCGADDVSEGNLWPLETSTNLSAGGTQNNWQQVTFCPSELARPAVNWTILDMKRAGYYGRFFTIQEVRFVSDQAPGLTRILHPPQRTATCDD